MSLLTRDSPAAGIAKAVRLMVEQYDPDAGPFVPLYERVIGVVERPMLQEVMQRAHWNQVRAAQILGINRNTLKKKLQAHGLEARRP